MFPCLLAGEEQYWVSFIHLDLWGWASSLFVILGSKKHTFIFRIQGKYVTGLQKSRLIHREGKMPEVWNHPITTTSKLFHQGQWVYQPSRLPCEILWNPVWGSWKCKHGFAPCGVEPQKGFWGGEVGEDNRKLDLSQWPNTRKHKVRMICDRIYMHLWILTPRKNI